VERAIFQTDQQPIFENQTEIVNEITINQKENLYKEAQISE
jgi:hypothetical protein